MKEEAVQRLVSSAFDFAGTQARKIRFWRRLALVSTALLALSVAYQAARAHDGWIEMQRDPVTGSSCCGEEDCKVVPFDDIVAVPGGYQYRPTGEVIEERRARWHPDGRPRVCQWSYIDGKMQHDPKGPVRCLFIAAGGA